MYKLITKTDDLTNEISNSAVLKTMENGHELIIPIAPDNTDYQAYLKWVAEGNTPLPAENT
jgi:hypothetical protein